jgi:hypothetical protein
MCWATYALSATTATEQNWKHVANAAAVCAEGEQSGEQTTARHSYELRAVGRDGWLSAARYSFAVIFGKNSIIAYVMKS